MEQQQQQQLDRDMNLAARVGSERRIRKRKINNATFVALQANYCNNNNHLLSAAPAEFQAFDFFFVSKATSDKLIELLLLLVLLLLLH